MNSGFLLSFLLVILYIIFRRQLQSCQLSRLVIRLRDSQQLMRHARHRHLLPGDARVTATGQSGLASQTWPNRLRSEGQHVGEIQTSPSSREQRNFYFLVTHSCSELYAASPFCTLSNEKYEGRSINKFQNGAIPTVLKIWKIRNIRFVGNLILNIHTTFLDDDVIIVTSSDNRTQSICVLFSPSVYYRNSQVINNIRQKITKMLNTLMLRL